MSKVIKFYIDEPDIGDWGPMIGVRPDTQFYDSREEADKEVERLEALANICFCVWEAEVEV